MKHAYAWTQDNVKNVIWRKIQIALLDIKSTTDLNPKQVNEVYMAVDKGISEQTGVHVPCPCKEVA